MRPVFGAVATLLILLPAAGPAVCGAPDLREELLRFARSRESAGLSYCVVFAPVEGGPPPVDENSGRPFPPASLTKLVTTGFALQTLGAGFTFGTRVYSRGSILDGALQGDLVVQGGGDPFLVSERLWLFARTLAATGLREVRGDLIIDNSLYASAEHDPARSAGRGPTQRPYAATPAALTVNFNAACFLVGPGAASGEWGVVLPEPLPCGYVKIENSLMTVRGEGSWSLHLNPSVAGVLPRTPGFTETALAAGSIRAGSPVQRVYRSVSDPAAFAGSMVAAFLEDSGIRLHGSTRQGAASPGDSLLADFPSLPLSALLSSMNSYSNNLMADMIAMRCGVPSHGGAADSRTDGVYNLTRSAGLMTDWLADRFGAGPDERIRDGSGLHPDNRLAGRTIIRLLTWAWNNLETGPDFAASLPKPGGEGTLKNRFAPGAPATLRAKTGTYNDLGVSALAGYSQDTSGRIWAFVMILQADGTGSWNIPRMQTLQERWLAAHLR